MAVVALAVPGQIVAVWRQREESAGLSVVFCLILDSGVGDALWAWGGWPWRLRGMGLCWGGSLHHYTVRRHPPLSINPASCLRKRVFCCLVCTAQTRILRCREASNF